MLGCDRQGEIPNSQLSGGGWAHSGWEGAEGGLCIRGDPRKAGRGGRDQGI